MIIGIDLRCLPTNGSEGAGVAHAARSIAHALCGMDTVVEWKLFVPRGAMWKDDARVVRIDAPNGRSLRSALQRHPCDLLFVPSGAVAPGVRVPCVPLVHDVDIFDHPEWFSESRLRRAVSTRLFRKGIQHAKSICSVSDFTKNALVRNFFVHPDEIVVTSEGGDTVLGALVGEPLGEAKRHGLCRMAQDGVTNPYILFLGTLEPRKNLPFLIEAWLRARSRFARPVDLVIAGRDGWKMHPIRHAISCAQTFMSEGESRLHRIATLTDEDRRDVLLGASLVVVPSRSEGFGLVALEAMQAGTAVIASNAGGLPEVVGEHGCLLPSDEQHTWTEAMVHLMNDDASRHHIADQGKSRSLEMTWERSAEIVFNVLTKTT